MKLIRKLALVLLWAGLLTVSLTKAQDISSTGNLITQGNWVTPMGSPISYPNPSVFNECCSGGPGPAMNTSTNTLRFSYGSGYVQGTAIQSVGLGSVSALSLPGVKVTGLTYSWQIYNNLSSSGDTRGNLIGGISLTNKSNATVENLSFDYSLEDTGAAFKLFSNTVTFESQYSASSLDRLIVSFTGNDKNWWAGYYGPRVRDVNIGLNYTGGGSPGPSPAPTPPKVAVTNTTTAADTSGTASLTTAAAMADPTKNDVTSANAGGVQVSTTGEITPIVNVPKFVRDANDIGEKKKEAEQQKTIIKPPVVVAVMPPRRVDNAAVDVNRFITQEAASQVVEKQETIPTIRTQMQDLGQQQSRPTVSAALSTRRNVSNSYDTEQDNSESTGTTSRITNQFSLAVGRGQGLRVDDIPAPVRQSIMSATNPLNSYLTMVPSENAPDQKSTVKSNVQNNELAGGVDLSKIAIQPVGFNDYLKIALTDSAFYGTREVYQNQRVVDNARAQRMLQGASDRLHQEMVNSQYLK